jgi:hypothetical protein
MHDAARNARAQAPSVLDQNVVVSTASDQPFYLAFHRFATDDGREVRCASKMHETVHG